MQLPVAESYDIAIISQKLNLGLLIQEQFINDILTESLMSWPGSEVCILPQDTHEDPSVPDCYTIMGFDPYTTYIASDDDGKGSYIPPDDDNGNQPPDNMYC